MHKFSVLRMSGTGKLKAKTLQGASASASQNIHASDHAQRYNTVFESGKSVTQSRLLLMSHGSRTGCIDYYCIFLRVFAWFPLLLH